MIETLLLDSMTTLVQSLALTPTPKLIGVIEPFGNDELPALVVSVDECRRLGNGLGQRAALIVHGALAWQAVINLAQPVLPSDPSFSLLSPDRRQLTLPHGGLVTRDGAMDALTAADIQVVVNGATRTLVTTAPAGDQYMADPLIGRLTFGQPLPDTGAIAVSYFLGQWERRVVRGEGVLRLAVVASDANTARDLSERVLSALDDPTIGLPPGLARLEVSEIGTVGPDPTLVRARRRLARFSFEFEQEINTPESSGGVIQRIPVQALVD
jgi:hypothetical protein